MKFETPDIATAAFLLMKGFKLVSADNISGKYCFIFEDDGSARLAVLEFVNSDCQKFDSYMRALRGMMR